MGGVVGCECRYTLLHIAAGLGQTRTLELLLKQTGSGSSSLVNDSSNDDGATPLHAAAMAGNAAAVRLLLSKGADAGAAGADGTQAWELVPTAAAESSSSSSASGSTTPKKQQQHAGAPGKQQELQELQQMLQDAARKAGRSQAAPRSSKVTSRSEVSAAGAAAAAAAAQSPAEAYSEQFRQLSPAEQARKVEGFARLPATELRGVEHLSPTAKAAILQVGRICDVHGFGHSCSLLVC
jgi:ankyrin repeat protein